MPFANDESLGYATAQRQFSQGDSLIFDQAYRRAHLPLVNPVHPLVITESGDYRLGRYLTRRYSLVIPINIDALESSKVFQKMDLHLRQSRLSTAIAWPIMKLRRDFVHATLCGGFTEAQLPELVNLMQSWVATHQAPRYQINGMFNGSINTGRVYLKLYPEIGDGINSFQAIQPAVGNPMTNMWLAGYYHFHDELSVEMTQELATMIALYGNQMLIEQVCQEVLLLATHDDLALSGEIIAQFRLNS